MYLYKYVCEQMAVLRPVGRACLRLLTCFLFNIYTYLLGEHAIQFLLYVPVKIKLNKHIPR